MSSPVRSDHDLPSAGMVSGRPGATPSMRARAQDLCVLCGVAFLTIVLALRLYGRYLGTSRGQWAGLGHDRNAHLLESMLFALDLRYLDLSSFIRDLHSLKGYPPLFRFLAAPILAIGGFNYQLAALVSLAGWVGTVLLVFLLTRRLAPSHGNTAGLFAALCTIGSPPFRAYATDIMLESLGACLTLLVLYLDIRVSEEEDSARGSTLLGCGLTALFFLKYNYWFLTVFVLLLWEGIARRREIRAGLSRLWARRDLGTWVSRELRHPVACIVLGMAAIAGLLAAVGKQEFSWQGRRFTSRASLDLAYPIFVLLSIHIGSRSWRHREEIRRRVGDRAWRLICYHLLPVTVWLLWPLKIQNFLWYVSPMDASEAQRGAYWSWATLAFYPRAIAMEYHESAWVALVVCALALLAFFRAPRLGAHARLVLLFLAAAATLTILHPNHQSRFVHTWLPSFWVAGAVGLASVLGSIARGGLKAVVSSVAVLAILTPVFGRNPLAFGSPVGRSTPPNAVAPTALDLSDYYLPRIGCFSHVAIFATVSLDFFARWTYLQRYPAQRANLTIIMKRLGDSLEAKTRGFAAWADGTPTQAIVFIDIPSGSFFFWPGEDHYQQYRTLLESQTTFYEVERRAFPRYGATVSLLVRSRQGRPELRCRQGESGGPLPHGPHSDGTRFLRGGRRVSALFGDRPS